MIVTYKIKQYIIKYGQNTLTPIKKNGLNNNLFKKNHIYLHNNYTSILKNNWVIISQTNTLMPTFGNLPSWMYAL